MMAARGADEFINRMFAAVNRMLLEVLAATERKDYEDRRRRQALCSRRRELERHSGRNRFQPCNHRQDRRPSEGRRVDRPGRCDRGIGSTSLQARLCSLSLLKMRVVRFPRARAKAPPKRVRRGATKVARLLRQAGRSASVSCVCASARRTKAPEGRSRLMKRTLALALATFLGLGLLSTSLSVARDTIGGVTSWSGSYGTN
jgi:hypothetical protein